MASDPYIPRADRHFRSMAEAFANGISSNPSAYALSPAEAAWIMQQFNDFNAAFMVASNEKTRTKLTVIAKDNARSILKSTISNYSAMIRANQGVSDADKVAIGVRPRNVSHRRRTCPQTSPLLKYLGSPLGFEVLFFTDASTPDSRAKPYGAAQLELYVAYSRPGVGEPQPKADDAIYLGPFKKNPIRVPQDAEQEARSARPTYYARWRGFDGEVGPWSLPCSMATATVKAREKASTTVENKPVTVPDSAVVDDQSMNRRMAA